MKSKLRTAAHRHLGWWWGLILAGLLAACDAGIPRLAPLAEGDVILAFGDSLTRGTGAADGQGYPDHLRALTGRTVINAGVPGETTADGLARLPEVLAAHRPRLLLLCLGGNDMLRRLDPARTAENLRAMVRLAKAEGVDVVLVGVPEPRLFSGAPAFYADIAGEFGLPYEGEAFNEVLKDRGLKSDPIHANGEGYRRVAERLAGLLREAGAL